jgi:hydrogenase maturation protease
VRTLARPGIRAIEHCGEYLLLMESWEPNDCVIVVDAMHSGSAPGALKRFDAVAAPLPSAFFGCSTHAFGVAEAVELARALNKLPARLVVFGIEGLDFSAGANLSPDVEQTLASAASAIENEALSMLAGG